MTKDFTVFNLVKTSQFQNKEPNTANIGTDTPNTNSYNIQRKSSFGTFSSIFLM